jgi:hypothetical protein
MGLLRPSSRSRLSHNLGSGDNRSRTLLPDHPYREDRDNFLQGLKYNIRSPLCCRLLDFSVLRNDEGHAQGLENFLLSPARYDIVVFVD